MFFLPLMKSFLSLGVKIRKCHGLPRGVSQTPLSMRLFAEARLNICTLKQGAKRAGTSLPKNRKYSFPCFGGKEKGKNKISPPGQCHFQTVTQGDTVQFTEHPSPPLPTVQVLQMLKTKTTEPKILVLMLVNGGRSCFRKSLFIKARFSLIFLLYFSATQRNP